MVSKEEIQKNYIDQAKAAEMLDLTRSRISKLCITGRFPGAIKTGYSWIIPKNDVLNYTRLKPGVKPKSLKNINEKKILKEALTKIKEQEI